MTDEPKLHLSGWCGPENRYHPTDHAECQRRLDEGLLPTGCDCPDHTPRKDTT